MGRTLLILFLAASGVATAVTGCGGSSKHARPAVVLSMVAPTDGATIGTSNIEVLGNIQPKDAVVRVSGVKVRAVNGTFKRPMRLRRGVTRIKVVARARGYRGQTIWLKVRLGRHPAAGRSVLISTPNRTPAHHASSGSYTGDEAGFVASCTSGGAPAAGCSCVYRQLVKRHFDTEAQWMSLVKQWRRSFLSNGTIAYPLAVRDAILACARNFGGR